MDLCKLLLQLLDNCLSDSEIAYSACHLIGTLSDTSNEVRMVIGGQARILIQAFDRHQRDQWLNETICSTFLEIGKVPTIKESLLRLGVLDFLKKNSLTSASPEKGKPKVPLTNKDDNNEEARLEAIKFFSS